MAAIAKETGFKLNPVIAVLIASISPGSAMTASVAANAANAPAIDSIAILTVSASIIPPKASDMLSVERHIKYTKKIKLNARRHNVKFRSIQII